MFSRFLLAWSVFASTFDFVLGSESAHRATKTFAIQPADQFASPDGVAGLPSPGVAWFFESDDDDEDAQLISRNLNDVLLEARKKALEADRELPSPVPLSGVKTQEEFTVEDVDSDSDYENFRAIEAAKKEVKFAVEEPKQPKSEKFAKASQAAKAKADAPEVSEPTAAPEAPAPVVVTRENFKEHLIAGRTDMAVRAQLLKLESELVDEFHQELLLDEPAFDLDSRVPSTDKLLATLNSLTLQNRFNLIEALHQRPDRYFRSCHMNFYHLMMILRRVLKVKKVPDVLLRKPFELLELIEYSHELFSLIDILEIAEDLMLLNQVPAAMELMSLLLEAKLTVKPATSLVTDPVIINVFGSPTRPEAAPNKFKNVLLKAAEHGLVFIFHAMLTNVYNSSMAFDLDFVDSLVFAIETSVMNPVYKRLFFKIIFEIAGEGVIFTQINRFIE